MRRCRCIGDQLGIGSFNRKERKGRKKILFLKPLRLCERHSEFLLRPRLEQLEPLERLEQASDLFLKLLARKIRRRHHAAVDDQRMTDDETGIVAD